MAFKRNNGRSSNAKPSLQPSSRSFFSSRSSSTSTTPVRTTKQAPPATTTTTAPTTTTTKSPQTTTQNQTHPQPHPTQQQTPMIPQPSLGSSIMSGIVDGFTWGVGSAVGRRIVDGIFGPRTVQVEHTTATPTTSPTPTSTETPTNTSLSAASDRSMSFAQQNTSPSFTQPNHLTQNNCGPELDFYNRCQQLYPDSFSTSCVSYSDALKQCQKI